MKGGKHGKIGKVEKGRMGDPGRVGERREQGHSPLVYLYSVSSGYLGAFPRG
jgi:hypothetical protein